jgi:hypothetical protein
MGTDWSDKLAVASLLAKYFQLIDDKELGDEKMRAIFADDGTLIRPDGSSVQGPSEIAESNRKSFARFRATQQMVSDCVVDISGHEATLRANVLAMHLWEDGFGDPNSLDRHFAGGVVLRGQARRTGDGWRLTNLHGQNIWRAGSGFGMAPVNKG